jgi:hypothetical protein
MQTEEVETDREVIRVLEWRAGWLRAGGFTKRNANILASGNIDWRYANKVLHDCEEKGFDQEFVMELIQ